MTEYKKRGLLNPEIRRRGIYILPNLFTTAALFAGFYAIVQAMNQRFEQAAVGIFVAQSQHSGGQHQDIVIWNCDYERWPVLFLTWTSGMLRSDNDSRPLDRHEDGDRGRELSDYGLVIHRTSVRRHYGTRRSADATVSKED